MSRTAAAKSSPASPPLRYAWAVFAMGRPYFLVGATALYALGVASAWGDGHAVRALPLVVGLVLVWLVQLTTHYNNEFWDVETDVATAKPTRISSGSRVLVKGLVPRRTARRAAVITLGLAVVAAVVLMTVGGAGWPALAFIVPGLFVGWFYSNPPFKLVARGLGEVAIVIVSAFMVPGLAYLAQAFAFSGRLFLICAPLGLLTFSVTLAAEAPDIEADGSTGKRTLAVRMGRPMSVLTRVAALMAGWLAFCAIGVVLQPSLAWLGVALSLPFVGISLFYTGGSSRGEVAAMERAGLGHTLVLGYATLALMVAVILG